MNENEIKIHMFYADLWELIFSLASFVVGLCFAYKAQSCETFNYAAIIYAMQALSACVRDNFQGGMREKQKRSVCFTFIVCIVYTMGWITCVILEHHMILLILTIFMMATNLFNKGCKVVVKYKEIRK